MNVQIIKARASSLAASAGVAVALGAAAISAHAADAVETEVAAAKASLVGYGALLIGVAVAVWGIRKAISMWGK